VIPPSPDESGAELELLRRRNAKLQVLLDVSKQFGAERNVDKLLDHIVSEAGRIIEADRCSLYILDEERCELWTKIAHGLDVDTIRVPLGKGIAGSCAEAGQPILIADAYADPRFNSAFDKTTGYRTSSILAVPMLDLEGNCVGVLQALNKRDGGRFTHEDQEILMALGGQAAVALQNTMLQNDIELLFEGFVRASVYAIEARDPTTSGHSERVAVLTIGLAEALERNPPAPYRGVSFTEDELRELRYASLLHDFGKVGVREQVLVKASKLYPYELEMLRSRFDYACKEREANALRAQLEALRSGAPPDELAELAAELQARHEAELAELEGFWDFILAANRPTVLEKGGFERLQEIAELRVLDPRGNKLSLLTPQEVLSLSIPRGSLNEGERAEIQSHVTHTFSFLAQIPWTRDLRRIPEIAGKHHEKLNGRGYPYGVTSAAIPVQSRMMSVADIYDALTAKDRPYKKALPHELALNILYEEAKQGSIDTVLVDLLVKAEVYRKVEQPQR
jgi:HD-GYP domain-containing protein (c-di-GMP phosphodiesterase class II)